MSSRLARMRSLTIRRAVVAGVAVAGVVIQPTVVGDPASAAGTPDAAALAAESSGAGVDPDPNRKEPEWVWDSGTHQWGLWAWNENSHGWGLVRAQEQAPEGHAPVEEWVWDVGRRVWGRWHWDPAQARWLLRETRAQTPPGLHNPAPAATPALQQNQPASAQPRRDTGQSTRAGLVAAKGRSLLIDGRPFRYVGINAYGLNGRETGQPYPAEEVRRLFESLPRGSMIRTWAWQSEPPESLGPIVRAAEETGQRLIVTLTEGAGYDERPRRGEEWFARDHRTDAIPWVDEVVGRYKSSPAIGMWEIMNEPGQATDGDVSGAAMRTFMSAMASRIKAIDPDHLVGTGAIDCRNGSGWEGDNCLAINADTNIDVISVHDYADTYEGGVLVSSNFEDTIDKLAAVEKPIIIGEMGAKGGTDGECRSLNERAELYRRKFDAYFARGVSGINVWNWTAAPRGCDGEGYDFGSDDPLLDLLRRYTIPNGRS